MMDILYTLLYAGTTMMDILYTLLYTGMTMMDNDMIMIKYGVSILIIIFIFTKRKYQQCELNHIEESMGEPSQTFVAFSVRLPLLELIFSFCGN